VVAEYGAPESPLSQSHTRMSLAQSLRDNVVYATGYLSGRSTGFPSSLSDVYAVLVSRLTTLVSLPLPFLSFLAFPFFGGYSATISIAFFWLTWQAAILSYGQLTIEFYGTLIARLCFLIPALAFLAFDCAIPSLSNGIKSRGREHSPIGLGREKLAAVAGIAIANVLLGVFLQCAIELLLTKVLHVKSVLRITSVVLPWNVLKDVAKGFAIRGVVHYVLHRYVAHTYESPIRTWHLEWQHSIKLPFSLVAAYDHPANYLLLHWLPAFIPAYLLRFHVLTWCTFLGLASLEELFVSSGYAVLPSSILLVGMAHRCDEHFSSVQEDANIGNYGRWGVLDFVCGTTCSRGGDVADDVQDEAEKHNVRSRARNAVKGAKSGAKGKTRAR